MASRSLNKVLLIGNLTRDPELRYTPSGTAVCTFSVATNRQWVTESGEKKEDVEFHRIVAWQKLAEICGKFLSKGRKIYVEGRIQTRSWTGQDGQQRTTTEIVIEDMIILDSRRDNADQPAGHDDSRPAAARQDSPDSLKSKDTAKPADQEKTVDKSQAAESASESTGEEETKKKASANKNQPSGDTKSKKKETQEDVPPEDIPF